MRNGLAKAYLMILQIAGAYGALAALAFFVGLPSQLERGLHMLLPTVLSGVAVLVGVTLMRPRLMPAWFARPDRSLHLLPVLLGNGLLPLLFLMPCMGAVIALNAPEPASQSYAVIAAAPPFLLFGLAWWMGLALCVWPKSGTPMPPQTERIVPRRPSFPRLSPEALADLRRQREMRLDEDETGTRISRRPPRKPRDRGPAGVTATT